MYLVSPAEQCHVAKYTKNPEDPNSDKNNVIKDYHRLKIVLY